MQNQIKETERKRLFRRKRSNDKECDALNEANAYLLGISQLNTELDVLSHRDTHKESEQLTKKLGDQTQANLQKLDDALSFLCKIADIDIKGQKVDPVETKSPSDELDEALEFLCKIADIDIKQEMAVQKSADMVDIQVENVDAVNDDDSLWDEFVKERSDASEQQREKKTSRSKVRKFFRRLVGKK